jgi:hypothetical protein
VGLKKSEDEEENEREEVAKINAIIALIGNRVPIQPPP